MRPVTVTPSSPGVIEFLPGVIALVTSQGGCVAMPRSLPRVHLIRSSDLPETVAARYEQVGDQLTVIIRPDLLTEQGARVVADTLTTVLREHWRPVDRLRLVEGGGAA